MFTPEMYLPKPRVATHARYRGKNDPKILKYTEVLNVMFQRGKDRLLESGCMYCMHGIGIVDDFYTVITVHVCLIELT